MTEAEGAMKLLAPGSAGATPSTDTIRLEGTSRSVYLATSMLAPRLSSVALLDYKCRVGTNIVDVNKHDVYVYFFMKQSNTSKG
jgi:hypothetical protein